MIPRGGKHRVETMEIIIGPAQWGPGDQRRQLNSRRRLFMRYSPAQQASPLRKKKVIPDPLGSREDSTRIDPVASSFSSPLVWCRKPRKGKPKQETSGFRIVTCTQHTITGSRHSTRFDEGSGDSKIPVTLYLRGYARDLR